MLTAPSGEAGTANVDFVIFPPRWLVAEHTFRPPWYHRNIMSEFMGLICGQYDAKEKGFVPGGMSLHNMMLPHGPDAFGFDKASNAELQPQKLDGTMAFMFETRFPQQLTEYAAGTEALQEDYVDCWQGLERRFDGTPEGPLGQARQGGSAVSDIVLYDYWRSSASYRVRIALNQLGLGYRSVEVDLLSAEHKSPEHLARNPQGLVPVLAIDGTTLTQSLAIIEYLDETRDAAFLPEAPAERARVRALAHAIAMEIHPVCNVSVAAHVMDLAGGGDEIRVEWMRRFIGAGLARRRGLARSSGDRRILPRRQARARRLLPRAAALQCPSLGSGHRRARDRSPDRRCLRRTAGVPGCTSRRGRSDARHDAQPSCPSISSTG